MVRVGTFGLVIIASNDDKLGLKGGLSEARKVLFRDVLGTVLNANVLVELLADAPWNVECNVLEGARNEDLDDGLLEIQLSDPITEVIDNVEEALVLELHNQLQRLVHDTNSPVVQPALVLVWRCKVHRLHH